MTRGNGFGVAGGAIWLSTLCAALGLMTAVTAGSHAQEPRADDLVGKRVVQKLNNVTLRTEDQSVTRGVTKIYTYRVERMDGPSVWLKAEGVGVSGWGLATEFIPVEQAIAYFTEQVRAHPRDLFPLIMRTCVWLDQKEFDRALADSNLAVSLEPNKAGGYSYRGIVRFEKREFDKALADFDKAIQLDSRHDGAYARRGEARVGKRESSQDLRSPTRRAAKLGGSRKSVARP
jgi:hypothetical protein